MTRGSGAGRPAAAVATLGRLDQLDAKMAHGILRYCDNVVVVLDERFAGQRLTDVVPYTRRDVPIVAGLAELAALGVEEVVVGASPPGGSGGEAVSTLLADVLARGMWAVHGLHTSYADDLAIVPYRDRLVELRHVELPEVIAHGACASLPGHRVLTVASDCASGKMTTALELWTGLRAAGRDAAFVATGQTGMYIAGEGFPLDAVRTDFAAGIVERFVKTQAERHEFTVVEGQGAITHPAYSGVSLALLHGSAPDLLVFCHDVSRPALAYFDNEIEDLAGQIALTERLAGILCPATTVGVVTMFRDMDIASVRDAQRDLADSLGLPVFGTADGPDGLVDLISAYGN